MPRNPLANALAEHRELYSGLIRLHVLHHAAKEPIFGLGMIEELGRQGYKVSPGMFYPLLHSMEKRGLLRSSQLRRLHSILARFSMRRSRVSPTTLIRTLEPWLLSLTYATHRSRQERSPMYSRRFSVAIQPYSFQPRRSPQTCSARL